MTSLLHGFHHKACSRPLLIFLLLDWKILLGFRVALHSTQPSTIHVHACTFETRSADVYFHKLKSLSVCFCAPSSVTILSCSHYVYSSVTVFMYIVFVCEHFLIRSSSCILHGLLGKQNGATAVG